MKRRLLVAALFLLAGTAVWLSIKPSPYEPSYQGKPLRYWLMGYTHGQATAAQADDAVRHIGTNAIPLLLEMLESSASPRDMRLLAWSYTWRRWAQHQHLITISPIPNLPSEDLIQAGSAFCALGTSASNAAPALIGLCERTFPNLNYSYVFFVLSEVSPGDQATAHTILRELETRDPKSRANLLHALGIVRAEPKLVVPGIINALKDPDPNVREQAAFALQSYGPAVRLSGE